jgi:hypothetical protein
MFEAAAPVSKFRTVSSAVFGLKQFTDSALSKNLHDAKAVSPVERAA